MIPEFPQFKKLEFSDEEEIRKSTSKFPPYADFNFINMWSWDIKDEARISQMYGNLIVNFSDYLTGKSFYSFLGNNKVNETAEALLELSKKEGLDLKLKLVPEDSIKGLDGGRFIVKEDPDNFDYVLPIDIIKDFSTKKTKSRRKEVNSIIKNYAPEFKILDFLNAEHRNIIYEFIKKSVPDDKVTGNELMAIKRFFVANFSDENLIIMGGFINSKLEGISCTEILGEGFFNSHFAKANSKEYKPMYSFMLQEEAKLLHSKYNGEFLNIEQDLGLEGLRKWKASFGTNFFLRKYTISLDATEL